MLFASNSGVRPICIKYCVKIQVLVLLVSPLDVAFPCGPPCPALLALQPQAPCALTRSTLPAYSRTPPLACLTCLAPAGSLRSDQIHPAGILTRRDFVNILPMIDTTMLLQCTGAQVCVCGGGSGRAWGAGGDQGFWGGPRRVGRVQGFRPGLAHYRYWLLAALAPSP